MIENKIEIKYNENKTNMIIIILIIVKLILYKWEREVKIDIKKIRWR